ncbi:MAG: multiple sugar transport system substrate-binding protein, partial [Mycobacterium sp.]|nr:multiple sugar transport system substrate-binding protein [Mycobacterium sp.]
MANSDEIAYLPLTFGYVNYAGTGFRKHRIAFSSIPTGRQGISGGVLGGAGLGISARSPKIAEAAAFLQYVAAGNIQASVYVNGGGQPGHRSAWTDPAVNAKHGNFFADTLPGIDCAYLRPRWPGYLRAQTAAAERLHAWLTRRSSSPRQLVGELDELFADARRGADSSE